MTTKEATYQIRLKQWAEIIKDRNASNLNINDYCDTHGITRHQYYYWLRRVRGAVIESSGANQLVELKPNNQLPAIANPDVISSDSFIPEMAIDINGVSLKINSNTPAELISKVLEVIPHA